MDPIRLVRQHWRPAAVAALLMLATVAWYAWPSSTSAAEAELTAPVKSAGVEQFAIALYRGEAADDSSENLIRLRLGYALLPHQNLP